MTEKRKIRTVVRTVDAVHEFEFLDDALEHLEWKTDGGASRLLDEVAYEGSTVLFLDAEESLRGQSTAVFAEYPAEHRGALILGGAAMAITLGSRDPVFVFNADDDMYLLVVSLPERIEKYVKTTYLQDVSLDPPPEHPARWVVSITRHGDVLRASVDVGINPGVGQA